MKCHDSVLQIEPDTGSPQPNRGYAAAGRGAARRSIGGRREGLARRATCQATSQEVIDAVPGDTGLNYRITSMLRNAIL
jgi:hypothetical protein